MAVGQVEPASISSETEEVTDRSFRPGGPSGAESQSAVSDPPSRPDGRFDSFLDATGNNIFLEIALLPGLLPKTAAATWWLWDRWNLRRFLPKPRK